ncbi:hypothetical protein M9Y10_012306 [Tritrichomonas musculus]|uniref:Uncharacterized protein n=1 Tax=Tritrichomonas musculus TaxID=1915356 RepID=A0ABR2ICB5_9EUKA
MSYQNTEAWEYLSRRWGSWFNVDDFEKITSLVVCAAAYMDCDPDDFQSFEQGVFWFQEFWLMVRKILDNTIIWDKYGWEIEDSKDK